MLDGSPCAVLVVLVFSVLSTVSSDTYGQDPDVPPRLNGLGTDPDSTWSEPWEDSPWPDLVGGDGLPNAELPDDALTEVARRSPTPSPFAINRWPLLHPARGLLVGLGTRKRHPPYHPVPRFRGATDFADMSYDFSDGPRTSGATDRSRSSKGKTYSAGELLNLLTASRKNKDGSSGGNIGLRYGMSR